MSMVIAHNMAALNTLTQMGRNDKSLAKALGQISSGERINSAGDDASGYSISEKMKASIRALNQCNDNTKTGHSMLKIATEAINQQVEIMRKVYTIALKASDDTYTDFDRSVLQHELDELHDQLDDIAYQTTYNGKKLLCISRTDVITETDSHYEFDIKEPYVPNQPSIVQVPNVPMESTNKKLSGRNIYGLAAKKNGNTDNIPLDFSNFAASAIIPTDFDKKGFSIGCDGCSQFFCFSFDATTSQSTYVPDKNNYAGSACFIIGIKDVTNLDELYKQIFDGTCEAMTSAPPNTGSSTPTTSGTTSSIMVARGHSVTVHYDAATKTTSISKTDPQYAILCDGIIGAVSSVETSTDFVKEDPGQHLFIQGAEESSQETSVYLPRTTMSTLYPKSFMKFNGASGIDYPLDFVDPDPNNEVLIEQWKKLLLNDGIATPFPVSLNGNPNAGSNFSIDDCVSTRAKASAFLQIASNAIDYLLDSNTTVGAQLTRLDFMSNNLVTQHENTTNAESVIRDADMAKAMTEFTKNNVLSQAAQSMLAQANQNSSNVLSLLQ